jgi:hypothetical protein
MRAGEVEVKTPRKGTVVRFTLAHHLLLELGTVLNESHLGRVEHDEVLRLHGDLVNRGRPNQT